MPANFSQAKRAGQGELGREAEKTAATKQKRISRKKAQKAQKKRLQKRFGF
jgi:hypothetical protein